MSQGEKIVGTVVRRRIIVRARRGVLSLAVLTVGLVSATSLSQVQAHDEARFQRDRKAAGAAELYLPDMKPGTYKLIVRRSEDTDTTTAYKRLSDVDRTPRAEWLDRSPAMRLRVPAGPAPDRVAMPSIRVRTPVVMFSVPKNFAMIDAPRRVVARKRFEAGWSGPNVSGDRLELVARGQQACETSVLGISVHEYDSNRDGEFAFLAPMRAGNYEIVYCSADQKRVLARHPIQVVNETAALPRPDRVSRLRPDPAPRVSKRYSSQPSLQLNSSVRDDDAMPRVRMMAPIASVRTDDLSERRSVVPVLSIRPKQFTEDHAEAPRVVTPVGRYRFDDRDVSPARPSFTVRPKFEDEPKDDELALDDRDEGEVVDIAPRRRSFDEDDVAAKPTPRIRIFAEDELADEGDWPARQAQRPQFEPDEADEGVKDTLVKPDFEPEIREAKRPTRRFFDDEPLTPRSSARRPVFDDDDVVRPRKKAAVQPTFEDEPTESNERATFDDDDSDVMFGAPKKGWTNEDDAEEKDVAVKTVRKPSFDDEDPFKSAVRDDAPIDRADDFKSDEVGVAAAIARNKARYGDGADDLDEYFTIRGRYNWYKPVPAGQNERTAGLPDNRNGGSDLNTRQREPRIEDRRRSARDDQDEDVERDSGRLIELKGRDDFDDTFKPRRRLIEAGPRKQPQPREQDFDDFASVGSQDQNDGDSFGPPVQGDDRRFASRKADTELDASGLDFDPRGRSGAAPTGPIEMVRKTRRNQVAPQFDRIQPVKAGYRFAAGWTGDIRGKGWIAIARDSARLDDYLSLQSAATKGELKFRAPSEPGRYELRFLSQNRRVVLARQSFEVEAAPVRLVALEFVDPSDDLNVWWAGPGDRSDSLTLARVGARDSRYLSKQSVGTGNPLKIKAPTQPGTYEMRYVNGTDNRVLFRRKIVVAESQPTLLGP